MELTTRNKVIIVVVYTAAAVATGRYLTPVKIKTEIKTVEVEKKIDNKQTVTTDNKNLKTVVTETSKPNGEKVVTTVTEDKSVVDTQIKDTSTDVSKKDSSSTKEIIKEGGHTTISALGALNNITNPTQGYSYGLMINRDLIGPFNLGLFGLSSGTAGVSLGLSF